MDGYSFIIIALIGIALAFDFLNGLHDAANSIATVVSTRVLSPQLAVVWAAFFNFIAFLFFSHAVANTIGKGIIDPEIVTPAVIFGALMGAIIWNILTWLLGIPSSSSHALVGGLMGAGVPEEVVEAGAGASYRRALETSIVPTQPEVPYGALDWSVARSLDFEAPVAD